MSDVTLSKAVRSNLLNLQSTATSLAKTQERLATGLKVNSALDNPTNFFTASSLNSRASDMSNLLDSMSNGIKTIETADNGLKAITKTVETLQATARQARQDKSFKATSYALDAARTGNLSFSGGSVGTTPVNVALASGTASPTAGTTTSGAFSAFTVEGAQTATASVVTAASAFAVGGIDLTANADNTLTFDVDLGGTTANITLDRAGSGAGGAGGDNTYSITEAVAEIQAQIDASGIGAGAITVADNAGTLTFTATAAGATALTVDNVAANGTGVLATTGDLGISNPTTTGQTDTGLAALSADDITFNINVDGAGDVAVTLTAAQVAAAGNNDSSVDSLAELTTVVQAGLTAAGVTGVTVGDNGTALTFTSNTTGVGSSVAISAATANNNNTNTALAITGSGLGSQTAVAGAATGAPTLQTVDQLVATINANTSLADKVRASNDNGKLRIENLSTADLTVTGVSGTDGEIDGSTGTSTVGGNDVRKNLVNQFNELRTQLDKLSDDASFNGINLLRGDKLKLTFNETGTSTIEIQAKDSSGAATSINSGTLSISAVTNADFDSDTTIDSKLESLSNALGTLRSQASAFGSNLSIVQNRQDFTKEMINTLETGAANLTLADSNEEAANLLALQTRQQLSSTALSLASQADQNVLRLF